MEKSVLSIDYTSGLPRGSSETCIYQYIFPDRYSGRSKGGWTMNRWTSEELDKINAVEEIEKDNWSFSFGFLAGGR
jgi:hypothetical protein